MGALFIFAASLQLNDADPLRWFAIYMAAALPCWLEWTQRPRWLIPAIVGAVSFSWAMVYALRGAWTVPFGEMFAEWEMKNQQVLETREMFGLLVITSWMLALAAVNVLRRRRSSHS
ncbi:MAG TPA: transmembrane 220 family protein [Nitrospiraceae bacterium]